ncbi:MAG: prepilin-type N-terminal cleavage/methylation domain-containing protein [Candidatus Staskawiczbacteria bacterium]|nr:prepilin-type N-terminal cleavage/methylation domain-containing protein [Candidatus Staskawiczbacteria bacterium]
MFRKKLNLHKGFTILELMVVLSIIAVLFAVVFVDVVKYINKSKDTAIKTDMAQLAYAAGNYYSDQSSFSNLCRNSSDFVNGINAISDTGSPRISCWDSSGLSEKTNETVVTPHIWGVGEDQTSNWCKTDEWVMVSTLVSEDAKWCIDSTGVKEVIPLTTNLTECHCPPL